MEFLAALTFHVTDPAAVGALVPQEIARIQVLKAEGKILRVVLTQDRARGFIELRAASAEEAHATLATLPLHRYMQIDLLGPLGASV